VTLKYLVSDEHWDLKGYKEYKKKIAHLFDKQTSEFILSNSFHDGYIKHLELINHVVKNRDEEKEDPTSIRMIVEHYNGVLYEIMWNKVRKFFFDYDITRNVFFNTNTIVCDGMRGIDEWGYDEIILMDDKLLSHEIDLFSKTKIIIFCKEIKISPILE
jgi:hypothetical protein